MPAGVPPTLAQFAGAWLDQIMVRPSTRENYRQKLECHLAAELGGVRIDRLTPARLDEFFRVELRSRGPHLRPSALVRHPLSAQSVLHLRTVLHSVLAEALRQGYLLTNPVAQTRPIRVERYEASFLSSAQARQFLCAAGGERLEALYWVTLSLGLRQGEALALRWSDLDLDARRLSVRATLQRRRGKGLVFSDPKTKKSRRTLPLPELTLRALRAHRTRQNHERLLAGALWEDRDLVFATRHGRPLSATHVMRTSFRSICTRAGIAYGTRGAKGLRFHDLRHSAATLLLTQGVSQRVIMEILGHTRITTSERHLHVAPELAVEAAAAMDRALGAG